MNKIKIRTAIAALALAALAWPAVCQAGTHNHLANKVRTMSASQLESAYSYVESADVASSVLMPDGTVIWLVGDGKTINGQPVLDPHNGFIKQSNPGSPLFTPLLSVAGNGWPAGQYQQVPNWPDGTVFWMAAGIVDGGLLHVFGSRIDLSTGGFAAGVPDYYDATFSLPSLSYQGIAAIPAGVSDVAQGTNGYWLIGTDQATPPGYSNNYKVHAIWAGTGKVGDYATWNVYDDVIPDTFNLGGIVSLWRNSAGTWTAWTKTDDIMGSTIAELTAPHLVVGPWTLKQTWPVPYTWQPGDQGQAISYGVRVHPEQGTSGGTITVTVIENDPAFYGPHFLDLPY